MSLWGRFTPVDLPLTHAQIKRVTGTPPLQVHTMTKGGVGEKTTLTVVDGRTGRRGSQAASERGGTRERMIAQDRANSAGPILEEGSHTTMSRTNNGAARTTRAHLESLGFLLRRARSSSKPQEVPAQIQHRNAVTPLVNLHRGLLSRLLTLCQRRAVIRGRQ